MDLHIDRFSVVLMITALSLPSVGNASSASITGHEKLFVATQGIAFNADLRYALLSMAEVDQGARGRCAMDPSSLVQLEIVDRGHADIDLGR